MIIAQMATHYIDIPKMDIGTLIALVYEKPPLWNRRHKWHSNRNVIDKCWKDISAQMKEDEHKLRKKWRYLRDQFAVELGKIPPEETDTYPKWPYFKSLLFLKGIVRPRITNGRVIRLRSATPTDFSLDSSTLDNQSSPVSINSQDTMSPSLSTDHNECDEENEKSSFVLPKSFVQRSAKKLKMSFNDRILSIEKQKLQYLQKKSRQSQQPPNEEDENLCFFKSLLPHVRKIPQHEILSFRNRIQEIVEEFAYRPQLPCYSPHTTTSNGSNVSSNSYPSTAEPSHSVMFVDGQIWKHNLSVRRNNHGTVIVKNEDDQQQSE